MTTLTRTLWIDASPAIVHSYFTDADKMTRWSGVAARLDPQPGGIYELDMGEAGLLTGRFVTVTETRIVQHIDNPNGGEPSRIEITLSQEAGGTRLTLTHSGLPHPFNAIAERGWDHHLARLSVAATGGTNPPDSLCTKPMQDLM